MSHSTLIYYGGVTDFFKRRNKFPFNEKIELPTNLKISNIYFRHKCFGFLVTIGGIEKNKHLISPSKVSIITYTPGKSFSSDIMQIIKRMTPDGTLNIAFNSSFNEGRSLECMLKDTKGAFKAIFNIRKDITINVFASNHIHIKALQVDDHLYTGSMNFSSTADSIESTKLKLSRHSYYNHEIIFHFTNGGDDLTKQILKKIETNEDSELFKINNSNYDEVLENKISSLHARRPRISDDITTANKIKKEVEKRDAIIRICIGSIINEAFVSFFDYAFDIMSESLFYYTDAQIVYHAFTKKNASSEFVSFIIDNGLYKIIPIKKSCEDEDEDEDEANLIYIRNGLIKTTNDCIESLSDIIIDENDINDLILHDRYDYDNGEYPDDMWGENSEAESERVIEENRVRIFNFIEELIDGLCDFMSEKDNHNDLFFNN